MKLLFNVYRVSVLQNEKNCGDKIVVMIAQYNIHI